LKQQSSFPGGGDHSFCIKKRLEVIIWALNRKLQKKRKKKFQSQVNEVDH
jgi:hypothetical protein